MEINGIAHIQITAGRYDVAREFYRQLLPFLGLKQVMDDKAGYYCVGGRTGVLISPPDPEHEGERFNQRRIGLHHLCFRARSREDIDEAHRFVIGSHRKLRKKDIREAGLQEIPGIGPSRKRALLHHFGTLKEIERASIADLGKVPGVSAESARKIFEFFHAQPG